MNIGNPNLKDDIFDASYEKIIHSPEEEIKIITFVIFHGIQSICSSIKIRRLQFRL